MKNLSAKKLTTLAVLSALVVVLQIWGGNFRIGATPLSFVLVPIVLGGISLGVSGGAFLGALFGGIVLFYGITGADGFTFILFSDHPVITTLLCLTKGVFAGVSSALIYKLFSKKKPFWGVVLASMTAPIVNTGIFILFALMMSGTLNANFVPSGQSVIYFLVIGCAGINFLVEFLINVILSPAVYSVLKAVGKIKEKK